MRADAAFPEQLMTTEAVATVLGKSPRTVRQMVQEETLPAVRLPRSRGYRFRPSAIHDFITACSVTHQAA